MALNIKHDNDILMVSAEINKLAKVGGLADVVYSLSKALISKGTNVSVIIPYYQEMESKLTQSGESEATLYETLNIDFGDNTWIAKIYKITLDTIPVFIVKNEFFFGGDYGNVYVDSQRLNHGPFEDDAKRFAFFSTVVAELLSTDKFFKTFRIIHCHDWHTGTLILNLKENKKYKKLFSNIKILFTIHNLDYQGVRPFTLGSTYFGGLSSFRDWLPDFYKELKKNKQVMSLISDTHSDEPCYNPMRTAINLADAVNTVSPTYMTEIVKPDNPKYNFIGGRNLENELRTVNAQGRLYGVLNGCNYDEYSPEKLDPPFGKKIDGWQAVKQQHKEKFIRDFKTFIGDIIDRSDDKSFVNRDVIRKKLDTFDSSTFLTRPLFVMVSRIVEQKVQMLTETINDIPMMELILRKKIGLMIIGTGSLSDKLEAINQYDNAFYFNTYSKELADTLYAVGDVFLMPSDFEPCGISQMIAMSYGTLPLVNKIGGLADTVNNMYNGFVFRGTNRLSALYNLIRSIEKIIFYYNNYKDDWQTMQDNAIRTVFSWNDSADKYLDIYKGL
jgi:starch synthase